ncbi:MAG: outer membrane beta-barrel protein [Bacteroidales bacterium]|nr:outer membrane beta-barrel protein [Bacteroidales bacterium]
MAAFVMGGFAANAQLTHLEQSIYLNFNLPTGQFNDDVNINAVNENIPMTRFNAGKSAVFGFGLGYRVSYRFDVGFGEVSPYIHGDFQWNRIQSDLREAYMNADNGSCPNYFNVPVYVGVNYRYQLDDIFTPFAEFGIGPDFFFITKEQGNSTAAGTFKMRYMATTNVAFQLGLGCYFGQHVSASLHYNGYGKHAIQYSSSPEMNPVLAAADASTPATQTRSVGMLSLRIGFHF